MNPNVERAIRDWMLTHQHVQPCLLVSREVEKIHSAEISIGNTFSLPHINVGVSLPDALLDVPLRRRTWHVDRWLEGRCRAESGRPILVSNIDLLFHPNLGTGMSDRLDPLALFRRIARYKPLLVIWPGDYDGETLTYAVPGHAHYSSWSNVEAKIITIPVP